MYGVAHLGSGNLSWRSPVPPSTVLYPITTPIKRCPIRGNLIILHISKVQSVISIPCASLQSLSIFHKAVTMLCPLMLLCQRNVRWCLTGSIRRSAAHIRQVAFPTAAFTCSDRVHADQGHGSHDCGVQDDRRLRRSAVVRGLAGLLAFIGVFSDSIMPDQLMWSSQKYDMGSVIFEDSHPSSEPEDGTRRSGSSKNAALVKWTRLPVTWPARLSTRHRGPSSNILKENLLLSVLSIFACVASVGMDGVCRESCLLGE